jgi:hypothetical protein
MPVLLTRAERKLGRRATIKTFQNIVLRTFPKYITIYNRVINMRNAALLFCFMASLSGASATLPRMVDNFARNSLAADWIGFYGDMETQSTTYYLFGIQQRERCGFVVIAADPELALVAADTGLDALKVAKIAGLGQNARDRLIDLSRNYPVSLTGSPPSGRFMATGVFRSGFNRILWPRAAFALHQDNSLGILEQLRSSSAFAVDPEGAMPGSILVSPTRLGRQGPVYLGAVGIVGSDRWVYGPNSAAGNRWSRLARLDTWITRLRPTNGVYAFLLRAA